MRACLLTVDKILAKLILIAEGEFIVVNDYIITKGKMRQRKQYHHYTLEKDGQQLQNLLLEDILYFVINALGKGFKDEEDIKATKYLVKYPEKKSPVKIQNTLKNSYSHTKCPDLNEEDVNIIQFIVNLFGSDVFNECVEKDRNVLEIEYKLLKFRRDTNSTEEQVFRKYIEEIDKKMKQQEDISNLVYQFRLLLNTSLNFNEFNSVDEERFENQFKMLKEEAKMKTCA